MLCNSCIIHFISGEESKEWENFFVSFLSCIHESESEKGEKERTENLLRKLWCIIKVFLCARLFNNSSSSQCLLQKIIKLTSKSIISFFSFCLLYKCAFRELKIKLLVQGSAVWALMRGEQIGIIKTLTWQDVDTLALNLLITWKMIFFFIPWRISFLLVSTGCWHDDKMMHRFLWKENEWKEIFLLPAWILRENFSHLIIVKDFVHVV